MTKNSNCKCLLSNFIFRTNCCTNVILIVFLTFLKPIAIARENEELKHDYLGNKIVSHREYLTFSGGIRKQRNKIVSKKSTRYPQKSLFTYPSPFLQQSKLSAQIITTSGQNNQKENATEAEPKVLITEVTVRSKKGKLEDRLINEIYRVISTKAGEKTTREELQKDINAIFGTGFFSNVQALPEDTPLGVRVNFIVQPNPILTKVEIQANPGTDIPSVLPTNTTDEVFRKQYGTILNLRDLQEGIKQLLTKRYNDEGYVLANVIGSPKVSETGVVTLQVAEGVIEKIQVRFFDKNESATDEKGKPIKGVTPIKEILSTFQSKPGQVFQRSLIQKDLQQLYQFGIAEDLNISLELSKQDPLKVVVVINVINELITEWNVWTRKAQEALNAANANDYETAVKHYKELLEIFRINKLQEKEALTLNNLANLYRKSEKYLLAFDTYKDSLHILRNKAPFLEIVILINMAQVSYQLKKPEQAIDIYKEALSKIRELKNNPGTTNIFGSLGEVFEDDLKSLVPGYLTIAEIALTLDLTSTYITKGDYQQAIYVSNNNLNNPRNLVDVWANIVNNYLNSNFESFLDESEEGELLKIVPLLAQALSKTPEIYSSSILRFAYSDLGYESKAKIYEQRSKIVTQEILATSLASLNEETTNSSNPYIKLITNTIIFFLKDNKTEQEGQKITQEILSLLENKMDVDDSDSTSKELSSIIKSLVPVVIGSLTGIDQNKNTVIIAEDYLRFLNTIETEELDISEINEENNTDIKKTIIKSLAFNKMLTLSTIGNAYFNLGEKQKAVEYYNKAINTSDIDIVFSKQNLQLFKKYEQNPEQLSQLNQFMQIMLEMQIALKLNPKQRNEILSDFSIKLQKISRKHENAPSLLQIVPEQLILLNKARSFYSLGRAYTDLGELEKARTAYGQALKVWNIIADIGISQDDTPDSEFRYELARLEQKFGNLFVAKTRIENAIEKLENQSVSDDRSFNISGYTFAEYNYNFVSKNKNNLNFGIGFSQKGITGGNGLSLSIPFFSSCQTPTSYFTCKQKYFDFYINLLMQLHQKYPSKGYDVLAFEASERARKNVSEVFQLAPGQSLKQQNYSQRKWQLNQSVKLSGIQKHILDKHTLLLEYYLGENHSYLWVVSDNSLKTYTLPGRNEIEAKAREFYKVLTEPDGRTSPRKTAKVGLELAERILGKEVFNLIQQKRLLIVADGILQYIPFSALPNLALINKANGTQIEGEFAPYMQPLLVTNEIINLPSVSVLAGIRQNKSNRPTPAKGLAIFADPVFNHKDERAANLLMKGAKTVDDTNEVNGISISPSTEVIYSRLPGTQEEMKRITKPFSSEIKKLYFGFDANYENALSTDLSQYRFIHFATHGIFNNKSLERSGIVLSTFNGKGELQRGLISPRDVSKMNLSSADLVVLSGCRTGLSNVIRREALTGLTGGLMSAGAERVVVSLWSVNDEVTTELMERFYQKMLDANQPLPPAQALREAQLSMWKEDRFQAPYNWAAFTIQGEWR